MIAAAEYAILVQGPGSIGRLIAARLRRAGCVVDLLGRTEMPEFNSDRPRPYSIELHREDGRVETAEVGLWSIAAHPRPTYSALLVTTKAYDVRAALETGLRWLRPGAPVVVLSNGFGHDETLRELAEDRPALLGTIACGARAEGATVVRGHGEGPVRIGGLYPGANEESAEQVAAVLRRAGFEARSVHDGRSAQWLKGALNCGLNPVAALLGCPNGRVPSSPYFRWAIDAAREAAAVGRAEGVEVPESDWRDRLKSLCEATAGNRCSMLQDLEAGRRLEIDSLNGWIARRAQQHGVPVPRNRKLTEVLSRGSSREFLLFRQRMREGELEATR